MEIERGTSQLHNLIRLRWKYNENNTRARPNQINLEIQREQQIIDLIRLSWKYKENNKMTRPNKIKKEIQREQRNDMT